MKDELIINGKKYVHTPEVKEEKRLSGWTNRDEFLRDPWSSISRENTNDDDLHMVELRDGEKILSEDDARHKLDGYFSPSLINSIVDILGFKKDGVK